MKKNSEISYQYLSKNANLGNWREYPFNKWSYSNVREILKTKKISRSKIPYTFDESLINLDDWKVNSGYKNFVEFLESSHTDCFLVSKKGKIVFSWYGIFSSKKTPHIVFSISKSITALLILKVFETIGISIDEKISNVIPETKKSAYGDACIRNLLDMNVSSNFVENYLDKTGIFAKYRSATGWNPVDDNENQGLWKFLSQMPFRNETHGKKFHYCSPHTDLLGWILEKVSKQKINFLLHDIIFNECGVNYDSYITIDKFNAPRTAGGINICAIDLLKIAELVRCDGYFFDKQIISKKLINDIKTFDNKIRYQTNDLYFFGLFPKGKYRSNFYQTGYDDDELCGIGIHGQWLWINPKKEISIIKLSSNPLPLDLKKDRETIKIFKMIAKEIS